MPGNSSSWGDARNAGQGEAGHRSFVLTLPVYKAVECGGDMHSLCQYVISSDGLVMVFFFGVWLVLRDTKDFQCMICVLHHVGHFCHIPMPFGRSTLMSIKRHSPVHAGKLERCWSAMVACRNLAR